MRNILLSLVAVVVFTGISLAQSNANSRQADAYIPRTLSAGTSMSARTVSNSMDDTTQAFQTRGFTSVFVGLESATNDSMRILVSYFPSKDGVTFDAEVLLDSLVSTTPVGKVKYIQLPANAIGAHSVRVRIYGNNHVATYSSNPSTTLTTKIIRKHY